MEFIVVSDNHGKTKELEAILNKYKDAAGFIHCGDSELSPRELKPFHVVTGNNDYFHHYPEFLVVTLETTRIFVAHSHTLRYGNAVADLVKKAKEHDCTIACYGHTHRFDHQVVDGVTVINPGSLYYNRDGSYPSYAQVIVNGDDVQVIRHYARDLPL